MVLMAWRHARLKASLLMVYPTAIGRMPPFSFKSALSLAPNYRLLQVFYLLELRWSKRLTHTKHSHFHSLMWVQWDLPGVVVANHQFPQYIEPLGNDIMALLIKSVSTVNAKGVRWVDCQWWNSDIMGGVSVSWLHLWRCILFGYCGTAAN